MAAFDATPQVTSIPSAGGNTGTAATFVPQIWSDEIIADYEKNLVVAPLIKKMSMKGKKGDTIHVPSPIRGNASAKAAETQVTLIAETEGELVINIDQHWEYSRMIEDITEAQALSSLRRFYTSDAGYALAKQVDSYLFGLGTGLGTGGTATADPTLAASWAAATGTLTPGTNGALVDFTAVTTPDTFTDLSMRDALQVLDDNDVPMTGRFFAIPPALCNEIRGIERYNSTDFVNNKGTVNGKIGEIYGVDVYVTTNVPQVDDGGVTGQRMALLAQKDVYVLAEQIGVRSQTQYKQEWLSTLFTADRLYGATVYRPENGVTIAVA